MKKIIHIDMDAFYASIEQRDFPEYRGKPLAVGYAEARGVVAAASYEARRYGVRSAMPSKTALRKCPFLIFVSPRFEVYKEVSDQIMEIFLEYTDLVEPLSLDEAFLDVTENHKNMASATLIAKEIKNRIREVTGLTASAGVSYNKFLAKIASDYKKPDGLFLIHPKDAEKFVESLEIERFFGVGKVTAKKMHQLGIHSGYDLKQMSETYLLQHFGKAGHLYYENARAIDEREVNPNRIRKSIGAENTFDTDLELSTKMVLELYHIARKTWERIEEKQFYGRTITLKIKYTDFEIITRSKTFPNPVHDFRFFWDTSKEMLKHIDTSQKKVRLMGLTISNTEDGRPGPPPNIQLELKFKP
ncbi:DNA polymerase-4 [Parabacteroides sp. PF5-5]|uniref:DNA polymerase IV n=1 Tax=unclassified Parabacteroides TaxID=2649774 RepID=UPI002473AEDA|nr:MULTISPECIES: DNA polymerase IV [unclassified Parabacteroides]MDH6304188.1 DNA polymerase-4 [Parabacteroides sp. PH5-39]MDH6315096.1 DNA polymerase-4 [Parabacteroides sp. PF5-13]MDH6318757.1 DNA polymerase-4 [Parabacteroides sp. PH5-13]MDH6322486.1 DNA polymerase-4 [Parabacteroides sp. PH5-8]MDH6326378.1 DNA polymerase-4 [Parabacteroides sp. PH5-41]